MAPNDLLDGRKIEQQRLGDALVFGVAFVEHGNLAQDFLARLEGDIIAMTPEFDSY